MLPIARTATASAALLALSCGAGFPKRGALPASPRPSACGVEDRLLCLEEIASLPGGVVVLAGSLHDDANTVRSELRVSRDGGLTWRDPGLHFPGSAILDLRTFGTSNVWGLVTYRQEGCSDPTHVLRSVDAGATWSVSPLERGSEGLARASRFDFDDALHGLLSVADSLGQVRTFRTDDGGASWRPMWLAQRPPTVEEGADRPPARPPFPAAPIWEREVDVWRVAGWLRLRTGPDAAIIEELRIRGPDASASDAGPASPAGPDVRVWRELSRLRRRRDGDRPFAPGKAGEEPGSGHVCSSR